jgi:hypothetical protein
MHSTADEGAIACDRRLASWNLSRRDSIPQPRVAKRTLGWCSRSQRSTPKALHTRPPAAPPAPAAVSNPFRVLIPVFLHLPGVRFATPGCGMQRLRRRRGMPCKPNTALGRKPSSAAGAASENSPRREPWERKPSSSTEPRQGRWKGRRRASGGATWGRFRVRAAAAHFRRDLPQRFRRPSRGLGASLLHRHPRLTPWAILHRRCRGSRVGTSPTEANRKRALSRRRVCPGGATIGS